MTKNMSLEMSIYRAINAYDLMIFQNFTIDEITEIILPKNRPNESNALLKSFYNDLKLAFNSKKEKKSLGNFYSDLEDKSNFTCEKLFAFNNDHFKNIEKDPKAINLSYITYNLIKICQSTNIADTNDFRTVYERHFQYIRNGSLSINDSSYGGLLTHLITVGTLPRVSLFFNIIVINVIHAFYTVPHKDAIDNLIYNMKKLIQITEIVFLFIDIIAIFCVTLFYLPGIKKLC